MAGDWMKIELDLPDKPEIYSIAGMVNKEPEFVVGALIKIWAWFDKHTVDGNAFGVTYSLPDRIAGVTGFGEAMMFVGWLEQNDKILSMPKFDRHTSQSAKTRALTSKRVEKTRNANVTVNALPREEKRREDNNINKSGKREKLIPDDFTISDSVKDWAKTKNYKNLEKHFDHFVNVSKAKGYKYIDWDRAFMNAISKNWADVKDDTNEQIPEWKRGLL